MTQWRLCRDANPPEGATEYLVTVGSPETRRVWTTVGQYTGGTPPMLAWIVTGDDGWEPPSFYNCQVIAWAEMPAPWRGEIASATEAP